MCLSSYIYLIFCTCYWFTYVDRLPCFSLIREQECPGVFQYITDEMYRAIGLPVIKYPATVIARYEYHATKKRGREVSEEELVMEAEEGAVGGTLKYSHCTASLQNLLRMSKMSAPTPAHTPASTPASTPAQSPAREVKGDKMTERVTQPIKKKGKKEDDPGVVLITYKGSNFPEKKMSHTAMLSYIQKSKILKYIYQSRQFSGEMVENLIAQ